MFTAGNTSNCIIINIQIYNFYNETIIDYLLVQVVFELLFLWFNYGTFRLPRVGNKFRNI